MTLEASKTGGEPLLTKNVMTILKPLITLASRAAGLALLPLSSVLFDEAQHVISLATKT